MNLTKLLKEDHKHVRTLIKDIRKAVKNEDSEEALSLFEEMKDALTRHTSAEERAVYSQLESTEELRKFAYEGFEEHAIVSELLERISEMGEVDEKWEALFTVVSELTEHHIKEEESELFPQLKDEFEKEDLSMMAEEFESSKIPSRSKRGGREEAEHIS